MTFNPPLPQIDDIYRDILTVARRRARAAWFKCDRAPERLEIEHAQLIPALLRCDDVRRHRHYLDVERVRFVRACGPEGAGDLEPLWRELDAAVERAFAPVPVATAVGAMPLDYRNPATRRGSRC